VKPANKDLIDGKSDPDEQAFQIVFTILLDLGTLDPHVVDTQLAGRDQLVQIETQRCDIRNKVARPFLEAHENARLIEEDRAVDQKGRREQRFAAAGRSADQGRPALRQTAKGHVIETRDARR
jgi:hypothetical protein